MMFFGGMFISFGIPLIPHWNGLVAVGFFMTLFGPMIIIMSLLKTKEIKPKKTQLMKNVVRHFDF